MEDSADKRLSLLSLPYEVLSFIIPDPFLVARAHPLASTGFGHDWLAIRKKRERIGYTGLADRAEEALEILRLLSQVCKSLRKLTLPKLWAVVGVETVEELGRLRETLRVSPHLARHVRSFAMKWSMDGDSTYCREIPRKEGSMLELAFRDRFQIWDDLRQEFECEAEWKATATRLGYTNYHLVFVHNDTTVSAPGYCTTGEPEYDEEGNAAYAAHRGNGPDGDGEDRLVKSADDFTASVGEIVAQLKWLETFAWHTEVTSMPLSVFRSLAKLTTLRSLGHWFSLQKGEVCAVPLWELAGGLEELSMMNTNLFGPEHTMCEEQVEEHFATFELSSKLPKGLDKRHRQNFFIALRTIVTAAKGDRLSRLLICGRVEEPFAIRALLPYWVRVEAWDELFQKEWSQAALALRPLLAHASLWHITRKNRLLIAQDVQDLQRRFEADGVPKVAQLIAGADQALAHYLSWLREDDEVAGQVACAWNQVVLQGGANVVQCQCDDCKQ